MKQHILPAIRLTFVCIICLAIAYPLLIWLAAQAAPGKGEGVTVSSNGRVVGYTLIGQSFTQDRYFNSRPSASGYDAMASGGSNKGPSDSFYLKEVQARIDSFLVHNPSVRKEQVPSDIVTASGSGLDPDISEPAANIQVPRIAKVRNVSEQSVALLVKTHTCHPFFSATGKVNVLELNIALDHLK